MKSNCENFHFVREDMSHCKLLDKRIYPKSNKTANLCDHCRNVLEIILMNPSSDRIYLRMAENEPIHVQEEFRKHKILGILFNLIPTKISTQELKSYTKVIIESESKDYSSITLLRDSIKLVKKDGTTESCNYPKNFKIKNIENTKCLYDYVSFYGNDLISPKAMKSFIEKSGVSREYFKNISVEEMEALMREEKFFKITSENAEKQVQARIKEIIPSKEIDELDSTITINKEGNINIDNVDIGNVDIDNVDEIDISPPQEIVEEDIIENEELSTIDEIEKEVIEIIKEPKQEIKNKKKDKIPTIQKPAEKKKTKPPQKKKKKVKTLFDF